MAWWPMRARRSNSLPRQWVSHNRHACAPTVPGRGGGGASWGVLSLTRVCVKRAPADVARPGLGQRSRSTTALTGRQPCTC
eukprot:3962167-Alexandrium_andersonii.AAC.1